jgi:hypothetical protein
VIEVRDAVLGFAARCTITSIQASSSSPLRIRTSARRTIRIWLGRISMSCGFWPKRAMRSIVASSLATARVST